VTPGVTQLDEIQIMRRSHCCAGTSEFPDLEHFGETWLLPGESWPSWPMTLMDSQL